MGQSICLQGIVYLKKVLRIGALPYLGVLATHWIGRSIVEVTMDFTKH